VSREDLIQRLRQQVKYFFVTFNENHSFDNEFGTFPGANGLFASATPIVPPTPAGSLRYRVRSALMPRCAIVTSVLVRCSASRPGPTRHGRRAYYL
jgi:phospholipase C